MVTPTKTEILDALKGYLYEQSDKKYEAAINSIAVRQQAIMNLNIPVFVFQGEIYNAKTKLKGVIPVLDRSLAVEMTRLLRERRHQDNEEKYLISNTLSTGLSLCRTKGDMLEVIPSQLHLPLLRVLRSSAYPEERQISDNLLAVFRETHATALQTIRERLVINLLI